MTSKSSQLNFLFTDPAHGMSFNFPWVGEQRIQESTPNRVLLSVGQTQAGNADSN